MADPASLEQFQEFAIHRSARQLKEAEPRTWAPPRLTGEAQAAMAEIQHGGYGAGVADAVPAHLFDGTLIRSGPAKSTRRSPGDDDEPHRWA
jgi:hypothetical protein